MSRSNFFMAVIVGYLGVQTESLGCGGMTFPGSLLCSPSGTLITVGTISRPPSPTAYPPNFVSNNGGGYTAVWPNQSVNPGYSTGYSPGYAYPSYGYPSYSLPSYSYAYPSFGGGSSLMPSFGLGGGSCGGSGFAPSFGGSLLMPSFGLGGGNCGSLSLAPATGPYFGLGSYGGYTPVSSYSYPANSSCGTGALVSNHGASACGSPNFASSAGTSPRLVCVMCGLARNLMRPVSRARTLFSNRFY